MIKEIEGVGCGTYLVVLSEITSINMDMESRSGNSLKFWHYLHIHFKTGRNLSISFQEEEAKCKEAYFIVKNGLKVVYAKDSVKDIIKQALQEND